jgi:hypothetical protein
VSGQGPPYEIRYAPAAEDAVGALPPAARSALAGVLRQLAADPMAGDPYDARRPPEFRTMPFGGGLLAYVVLQRKRQVVIEHVTWID